MGGAACADLSLHLVTDRALSGPRGVVATVTAAVYGGVTAVQLRDKEVVAREAVALAGELLVVLEGTGVPLLVNDRLDVALAAGAQGVHLGQGDLPVEDARRLAGPGFLVGLSVSTAMEVDAAGALPAGTVDYLAVGPVFPTATKQAAPPAIGTGATADLCRRADLPCVGIGGIGPANAAQAWAAGLDGIAVVSAICAAPDPAAAAAELLAAQP